MLEEMWQLFFYNLPISAWQSWQEPVGLGAVHMHCWKAFFSLLLGRMKKSFASLSRCLLSFCLLETFGPGTVRISKTLQAGPWSAPHSTGQTPQTFFRHLSRTAVNLLPQHWGHRREFLSSRKCILSPCSICPFPQQKGSRGRCNVEPAGRFRHLPQVTGLANCSVILRVILGLVSNVFENSIC